jgi:hypothetical protein
MKGLKKREAGDMEDDDATLAEEEDAAPKKARRE